LPRGAFCRPAGGGSWQGWILSELLVALVLAGFFTAGLFQTVWSVQRCLGHWDRRARMRQALVAALFCLARDVRLAGCNPLGGSLPAAFHLEGADAETTRLVFAMDKRGPAPGSWPDGDGGDPDEQIEYRCQGRDQVLRRNGQPVIVGIQNYRGEVPLFQVRTVGSAKLLEIDLRVSEAGETQRLATWVQIRNPW
jgi:type II secretory pathway component PulJ